MSALVLSAGNVPDADLWGHLRFGQDMLATGDVVTPCTYAYTAADHPWINQEYLSEVIFAAVDALAGPVGWLVMKTLLGLGVLALVVRAAERRAVDPVATAVVVVLTAYNVAPGWNLRPHVFTYALFALMIVVLDAATAPSRERAGAPSGRPLWVLPPLFALWANLHGAFFAGLCVLVLYLVCRSAAATRHDGRGAIGRIAGYGMLLVATIAATLLNPYGVGLWRWLAAAALQPRPHIAEWEALHIGDPRLPPFVLLLALTAAAWARTRRPRDATHMVLLAVTAWQSWLHVRHIPLFAILAGLWAPPHVDDLLLRLRGAPSRAALPGSDAESVPPTSRMRALRAGAWVVTAAALVAVVLRSRALWVDASMYPVAAFDFMAAHRLRGKLVVNVDWAQYAIAAFAPETTVAFDFRLGCYPQAIADMSWDFFLDEETNARRGRTPLGDAAEVLRYREPDLVLLSRRLEHPVWLMDMQRIRAMVTHARPEWTLLYQDAIAQLWGRTRIYDDPASPALLPAAERRITDAPQSGLVPWPALPTTHVDTAARAPRVAPRGASG